MDQETNKLPLLYALGWIIFSCIVISGSAAAALFFWQSHYEKNAADAQYTLQKLVTNNHVAPLSYFSQVLALQNETNLYRFSTTAAEKKLLELPFLKKVSIKKKYPDTLVIDYQMRIPIFELNEGMLIDEEGVVFSNVFFEDNEKLPKVVFTQMEGFELAKKICAALGPVDEMDLTNAFAPRMGKREVVVVVGNKTLRLPTAGWERALHAYEKIRGSLEPESLRLDLRLENIALKT